MAEKSSGATEVLKGVLEGRLAALEDRQGVLDREFSDYRKEQADLRLADAEAREKKTRATSHWAIGIGAAFALAIFAAGGAWLQTQDRVSDLETATNELIRSNVDILVPAIEALTFNQQRLGDDVHWLVETKQEEHAAALEQREPEEIDRPSPALRTVPATRPGGNGRPRP